VTVDRYLVKELLVPFVAGWALLTGVFAAFSAAGVLADAAAGDLAADALGRLILLRCVIAAEVIVPTSLFFAVLFAFERLNRDRELVALLAGGVSRLRLLRPVLLVGVGVLVLVALLATAARPWAYRTTYLVEDRATRPDVTAMRAGHFYPLGPDLVATAGAIDAGAERMLDVFARQTSEGRLRLIRAEAARLSAPDADGAQLVTFERGQSVILDPSSTTGDRRHAFERLRYRWRQGAVDGDDANRRARGTAALAGATAAKDVAEFQWRFTLPLLTFGMTLVAGALGTVAAGQVTAMRMVAAIATYVVVFNLAAAARSALENGVLPAFPGIWWLPLMPLGICAMVLWAARQRT
jgi:lipopolysaccharide export system permease protein